MCPSSVTAEMNDFEPWGDWMVGVLGPVVVMLLTLGAYESIRAISSPWHRAVGALVVLAAALVLTVGVTSGDVVPPYQLLAEVLLPVGAIVWATAGSSRRVRPRRVSRKAIPGGVCRSCLGRPPSRGPMRGPQSGS